MSEAKPTRAFLERTLAAMEGVIDVADRKTDEFDALRSCVIDLTLMLFSAQEAGQAAPSAMQALTAALKADPEYAWAWHCNLAMPIMDGAKVSHRIANLTAARLMRHLFDIDTEKHQHFEIAEDPQPSLPAAVDCAEDKNGLAWAISRWHAEVKNRPLQNAHRRTLDDAWRQVISYFGGNPDSLLGPSHDDLLNVALSKARPNTAEGE